ncbi:YitT family protein [Cytobacillus sp. FJAT-54145]|uniref:YitT family protein n=1 Tax=Cytobacillus spartinae TaxID=3299023 RepID=A0ABW6K9C3_9BACI
MKQLKRVLLLSIFIVIVGIGASLTLKVAIGVGAWDALAQSFSYLFGIKVGTIGMILNISCVLGQWLILRKNFHFKHLLQVPMVIFLGMVINFIFYDVLGAITIDSYLMKLVLFVIALIVLAFAVASVLILDVVTFPLEAFCMALAKKTKWKFAVIRQSVDIISILLAVIFTFGFSLPSTLREGTIIGMLIFAPLLGFFMKKIQPLFSKLGLIDVEPETIEVENPIKVVKPETI